MSAVSKQLASNQRSREALARLHGTLMSVHSIVVVAALTIYLSRIREEMLVQPDLINKYLLAESFNVVDEVEIFCFK